MIRRSARLAAPQPEPDRLSVFPQELFLRVCDYLVDYESELQLNFGFTRLGAHICPVGLAKGLRGLHCASKLLHVKTSTSICKLGFLTTIFGLQALHRMAGDPQIAPHITHVRLLFPTKMWLYHEATKSSCKQVEDMLTDCFIRLKSLCKIELSEIQSEVRSNGQQANYLAKMVEQSACALFCALHVSKACVTDLYLDHGMGLMISVYWPKSTPSPLPRACVSGFGNIEKFRVIQNGEMWLTDLPEQFHHETLRAEDLTITRYLLLLRHGFRYSLPCTSWMNAILGCRYDWKLTAFHASNFLVKRSDLLKRFLHTHSPTLQSLTITQVMVIEDWSNDSERGLKRFWAEIFQIVLDEMNLKKAKFHDLLYRARGSPFRVSAAMFWHQNDDIDLYGHRFEEVAKVRGLTRALADWKDGMVLVAVAG